MICWCWKAPISVQTSSSMAWRRDAWRHDEELGSITLRATPLAYSALGITEGKEEVPTKAIHTSPKFERSKGSKQAMLIEMLKRSEGATIQQVVDATGWLPHTVRCAIAGALKKKLCLNVVSEKVKGVGRVYRIVGHPKELEEPSQ